jgi:membrane-bound lytic murein transglycosylase D
MLHRDRHPDGPRSVLRRILPALLCLLCGAPFARATAPTDTLPRPGFDTYRNDPAVQAQLRYFLGPGRKNVERALARGTPYLSLIQRSLEREGLPAELAWLPLIESGFSSAAVSHAGATGMWQFMPGTARHYGLRVDRHVDERHDAVKSTRAAVRHLRDLTDRYGSPFLAAAAYNAGAGRVDRGLERLEIDEADDADFFRLSRASLLAAETREYVPKLIAAAMIAENPRKYGLRVEAHPGDDVDSMTIRVAVRLSRVARDLGVSLSVLRKLNPELEGEVTPADRAVRLRYPANPWRSPKMLNVMQARWEAAAKYVGTSTVRRIDASRAPRHRRVIVKEGETLASLAQEYGTTEEEICRASLLPRSYVLRRGQTVLLPSDDASASATGAATAPARIRS